MLPLDITLITRPVNNLPLDVTLIDTLGSCSVDTVALIAPVHSINDVDVHVTPIGTFDVTEIPRPVDTVTPTNILGSQPVNTLALAPALTDI
jgi:hypothetical protein